MRILLKCPSRSRPTRVVETLRKYVELANQPDKIGVALSCDIDDGSMNNEGTRMEILSVLRPVEWKRIFYSNNKTKIDACNANMDEIDYPWDIVVLVSDDMIPQIKGYDDAIRTHMLASFPDTNGILWFNDGAQGRKLNTLSIYGREMFEYIGGVLYAPEYKSFYCDTELTDKCNNELADKTLYINQVIIRHEHPGTGFAQNMDALYAKNQRYWMEDMMTYISRKKYRYDLSIMIPTIPGRDKHLHSLLQSIREKSSRICPRIKLEILIEYDNRETSVGMKRQMLMERAVGKYLVFIDDDDDITDAYFEDVAEMIRGNYHTMRLRGQIQPYTFTHSIAVSLNEPMARGEEFLRPPNHLNPMLADIAKLYRFKDAIKGEDLDWTIRVANGMMLKTEYQSDHSRIHYIYNIRGLVHPGTLQNQYTMSYTEMLKHVFIPVNEKKIAVANGNTPTLKLGSRGFVSSK